MIQLKKKVKSVKKVKMIPYSAAMAMDYMGYHHQQQHHHHHRLMSGSPGSPMMPGTGAGSFPHSWLVPSQDLYSAVTYNQFSSNQPVTHKPEPILDPRHVEFTDFFYFLDFFNILIENF